MPRALKSRRGPGGLADVSFPCRSAGDGRATAPQPGAGEEALLNYEIILYQTQDGLTRHELRRLADLIHATVAA